MQKDELVDLLVRAGADRVRAYSRNVQLCCLLAPWRHEHGTDHDPSMSISFGLTPPSLVHCFACGFSSTLYGLVRALSAQRPGLDSLMKEVEKFEKPDLETELDQIAAFHKPRVPGYSRDHRTPDALEAWPEDEIKPYAGKAPRWLVYDRRVPVDVCKQFQVGHDQKLNRAVFPVRNVAGELVGLQGRYIGVPPSGTSPWHNYWHFPKSHYLYGENAFDSNAGMVVLVEGIIDALVWRGYGIRNCMAMMGCSLSARQLARLENWHVPVYLAFDGDEKGRDGERVAVACLLERRLPVYTLQVPAGRDPDQLTKAEVSRIFAKQTVDLGDGVVIQPLTP